ncbi:hypothetical protein APA_2583 [Pseudanabaena sp. lw0831]|nr:hypothetical protein APA_2583 [Pseudanabaena sp. lw0831]
MGGTDFLEEYGTSIKVHILFLPPLSTYLLYYAPQILRLEN